MISFDHPNDGFPHSRNRHDGYVLGEVDASPALSELLPRNTLSCPNVSGFGRACVAEIRGATNSQPSGDVPFSGGIVMAS